MAGTSDQVFLRAFRWFKSAVTFLHGEIPAQVLADPLAQVLRTGLGLELDKTEATIDPSGFAATRAAAESLALATLVTGETVAALKTLGKVLADLQAGNAGLDDLVKVMRQIPHPRRAARQAAVGVLDCQAAADRLGRRR